MTNKDVVKLAEKYGGGRGHDQSKLYIFDQAQLADLVAEVEQRVAREIVNHIGHSVPTTTNNDWADGYKSAVLDVLSGVCVKFLTGEEGK